MKIKTAYSKNSDAHQAATELKKQIEAEGQKLKVILFFASSDLYVPEEISAAMTSTFSDAKVFGCSSLAETCNTTAADHTIVAMGFTDDSVSDACIQVVPTKDTVNITPAFDAFEKHFGIKMATVDYKEYCGIVLVDGLCQKEELLMDKIGDNTNILFTGGSASDSMKFQSTYVYANGKSYKDAAILALFKVNLPVSYIKTQSVDVTNKTLTVTKCDPEKRMVLEFNNQPATKAYSDAIGVPEDKVDEFFFHNPLGLSAGDSIFIRSAMKREGTSIVFYCSVLEGMELSLCKTKDMIEDTRQSIADTQKKNGEITGIVDFQCILRTLQLQSEGNQQNYSNLFHGIPTIGFSTYGEQFLGHMNQTSTMIAFH